MPAGAAIRSCYEAGGDGFRPHRLLTSLGVDNVVVDSSSIEVSRRATHAKRYVTFDVVPEGARLKA